MSAERVNMIPDDDAVCMTCNWRAAHSPNCPRRDEPWPMILAEQPKDFRTPEAKKWAQDFIPPETCAAIDDVQNALEHLRDANSQLRHAAHYWRRQALAGDRP
jgi:hypothetical protein